jgi:hypothetical protein
MTTASECVDGIAIMWHEGDEVGFMPFGNGGALLKDRFYDKEKASTDLTEKHSVRSTGALYNCDICATSTLAIYKDRTPVPVLQTLQSESSVLLLCPHPDTNVGFTIPSQKHLSFGGGHLHKNLTLKEKGAIKKAFGELARNFPNVSAVRLSWEVLKVLVTGEVPLLRLFRIVDLTVDGFIVGMTEETFKVFAASLASILAPTLRQLTLYLPAAYSDVFLTALVQARCDLHSVNLLGCYTLTEASLISFVANQPHLNTVRLEGADNITDAVLATLPGRLPPLPAERVPA